MRLVSWPSSADCRTPSDGKELKRARLEEGDDRSKLLADLDDDEDDDGQHNPPNDDTKNDQRIVSPLRRDLDQKYLSWQGSDAIPFDMFL
jgi:hypothetical protein